MNYNKWGHFSQIQKGSRIDIPKSSSIFYHLIVSMREDFCGNFSFVAQFSLTGLQISLILRESCFQIAFAVSLNGAI